MIAHVVMFRNDDATNTSISATLSRIFSEYGKSTWITVSLPCPMIDLGFCKRRKKMVLNRLLVEYVVQWYWAFCSINRCRLCIVPWHKLSGITTAYYRWLLNRCYLAHRGSNSPTSWSDIMGVFNKDYRSWECITRQSKKPSYIERVNLSDVLGAQFFSEFHFHGNNEKWIMN